MTPTNTVPMRTIPPRNKRRDVYLLEGSEYLVGTMNIDRHYIGDDIQSYIHRKDAGVPEEILDGVREDLFNSIRHSTQRDQAEALLDKIDSIKKKVPFPAKVRKAKRRVARPASDFFG